MSLFNDPLALKLFGPRGLVTSRNGNFEFDNAMHCVIQGARYLHCDKYRIACEKFYSPNL